MPPGVSSLDLPVEMFRAYATGADLVCRYSSAFSELWEKKTRYKTLSGSERYAKSSPPSSGDSQQSYTAELSPHIKVSPWKYREESTISNEQAAPETKGVTVKLLATVDLGSEIEGMAGRQLRMRMVTIEPGGVFGPIYDHKDRPGTVYILQGTITDHGNGVATNYGPGVGWPEDRNTTHWLENRGTIPAVELSVDIVRQE